MSSDKLSVIGLGYVGGTTARCFNDLGYTVYGVDTNKQTADKYKDIIKVTDYKEALDKTDISFVCVPTPCDETGDLDLSYLEKVCSSIKDYKPEQLVVIRSTVYPTHLNKLEKILGNNLTTNPEFLREATAYEDFMYPSFVIVGAKDKEIGERVMKVYDRIDAKKYITTSEEAQMIKYTSNVWHANKIAFTNEIGKVCKDLNIDGDKVIYIFKKDTKLNVSEKYHRIGKHFGGHCLPKDLSVMQTNTDKEDVPLIHSLSKSNNAQKKREK